MVNILKRLIAVSLASIVGAYMVIASTFITLPDGTNFDPVFYALTYPDVEGTTVEELANDYWFYGIQAGRLPYLGAADVSATSLIAYINQYRVSNGLSELTVNADLTAKAQARARELAEAQYFAHSRPDTGESWITIYGNWNNNYVRIGENLAMGQSSAYNAFVAWTKSSGHNAIMLHSGVTDIGVGVAKSISGKYYFVLHVGLPK